MGLPDQPQLYRPDFAKSIFFDWDWVSPVVKQSKKKLGLQLESQIRVAAPFSYSSTHLALPEYCSETHWRMGARLIIFEIIYP